MESLLLNQALIHRGAITPSSWTPELLSRSLIAWYDASDTYSVEESGGSVSAWRDQSGNGNDFIQATGSLQPTVSGGVITFDGTSDYMTIASISYGASVSMFVVRKSADTFSVDFSALGVSEAWLVAEDGSASTTIIGNLGSPTLCVDGTPGTPATRDDVHTLINDDATHIVALLDCDMSTWGELNIGMYYRSTPTVYTAADYSEIVITRGGLSTLDLERIEGYLAHKWSLEANLPAGHPFKDNPPERY